LISARLSLRRMRFLACSVLAMSVLTSGRLRRGRNPSSKTFTENGSFPPESGALSCEGANRQANRSFLAPGAVPCAAPALDDTPHRAGAGRPAGQTLTAVDLEAAGEVAELAVGAGVVAQARAAVAYRSLEHGPNRRHQPRQCR